jgi:RimJ/RimL family protein N-acetyltransferase
MSDNQRRAFRKPDPPLADGVVRLRDWQPTDAEDVFRACQDPEIARWIPPMPQPYSMGDATEYIAHTREAWELGTEASFAIVDPETDRVLGSISLHRDSLKRWSVGYWVAPWARRRGVATHALRLVSRWAIREYELVRLALLTLDGNEASQRAARACGFHHEGVLRNALEDRNGLRDEVLFSLIPSDIEGEP